MIEPREEALKKYGVGRVYVGTGRDAAKEARALGCSKTVYTRIRTGKQDYYTIRKDPLPLCVQKRDVSPNTELQKDFGRKKIVIGTGKDAALQARQMGASRAVCERIYHGKQDFFYTCYKVKTYDISGFHTDITIEIARTVETEVARYTWDENIMNDVSQEVLIQISSKKHIKDLTGFIGILARKYVRLFFLTNGFMRTNPKQIYIEDYGGYLV